jgi:hypothetical protein
MSNCPFYHKYEVVDHTHYFSDNSKLTLESMKKAHTNQNITSGIDIKARAIANLLQKQREKVGEIDSDVVVISKTRNPCASGIWDDRGKFDELVYDQLANRALTVDGQKFITESIFWNFIMNKHKNNPKIDEIATWAYYVIPITWKQITKGSIQELFKYFHDGLYIYYDKDNNHKEEYVLTVDQIKKFYIYTNDLMDERSMNCKYGKKHPFPIKVFSTLT